MTADPLAFLRAAHATAQAEAEAARDVDYAQCGVWEARGPYPAASGEADGVSRPRGNLRSEIGKDDIFLDAELPWDLIPHMARHDPAAVLCRIERERKLIAAYEKARAEYEPEGPTWDHDSTVGRARTEALLDALRCTAEGWGWTGEA